MKLCILFLLFFTSTVYAGTDYKCVITNAVQPESDGKLKNIGDKSVVGKIFTVERNSGIMAGVLKNNYSNLPKVIDYGSKENSFKAITIMKNNIVSNIHALIIEEFSLEKNKPFIYMHNLSVFYGTCIHF